MSKLFKLFKMNLQLFAEEEEETAETTEEETKESEEEIQTEIEEETEETEEEPIEEKLKRLEQEKKAFYAKMKKAEAEAREHKAILARQEAERRKLALEQNYLTIGYPEHEARRLAERDVKDELEKEEIRFKLMDMDIKELAGSEEYYSDAVAYAAEIKAKMKELKVDAKTAYNLIRDPAERTKEILQLKEQRNLLKRREVASKKVENSSPSQVKNPYPLDEDDKKALAELQKAQPDAGWTAEKYYKMMKT